LTSSRRLLVAKEIGDMDLEKSLAGEEEKARQGLEFRKQLSGNTELRQLRVEREAVSAGERKLQLEKEIEMYGPAARIFPGERMTEKLNLRRMEPGRRMDLAEAVTVNVREDMLAQGLGEKQIEETIKRFIKGNERKLADLVGVVQEYVLEGQSKSMLQAVKGLEQIVLVKAMVKVGREQELAV
jgi:hypothetical protein